MSPKLCLMLHPAIAITALVMVLGERSHMGEPVAHLAHSFIEAPEGLVFDEFSMRDLQLASQPSGIAGASDGLAEGIDRIITGVSVTMDERLAHAERRARYMECGLCGEGQAYPGDLPAR